MPFENNYSELYTERIEDLPVSTISVRLNPTASTLLLLFPVYALYRLVDYSVV